MSIEAPQEFKQQEDVFSEWDFETLDEELNQYRTEMQIEEGKKFKGLTLKNYFRYLNDKGLTRIVFLKDEPKTMSDVNFAVRNCNEFYKFQRKLNEYYQWKQLRSAGNFGI